MTNPNCPKCGQTLVSKTLSSKTSVVLNQQTAQPEWKLGETKAVWYCETDKLYWKKGSDSIIIHTGKRR